MLNVTNGNLTLKYASWYAVPNPKLFILVTSLSVGKKVTSFLFVLVFTTFPFESNLFFTRPIPVYWSALVSLPDGPVRANVWSNASFWLSLKALYCAWVIFLAAALNPT